VVREEERMRWDDCGRVLIVDLPWPCGGLEERRARLWRHVASSTNSVISVPALVLFLPIHLLPLIASPAVPVSCYESLSMGAIKTCHVSHCRIAFGCLVHGLGSPSIDDGIPVPGTYFPVFVSQAETDIQSNINTFSKATAFHPM
jgi:hypothetical protein